MNIKENVSKTEILNFPNYYNAGALDYGNHGPEMYKEEVYLTLYHFMEFNNINTRAYNTFALGGYLSSIRPNDPKCKYSKFSFAHTKHSYSFFVNYIDDFKDYLNN